MTATNKTARGPPSLPLFTVFLFFWFALSLTCMHAYMHVCVCVCLCLWAALWCPAVVVVLWCDIPRMHHIRVRIHTQTRGRAGGRAVGQERDGRTSVSLVGSFGLFSKTASNQSMPVTDKKVNFFFFLRRRDEKKLKFGVKEKKEAARDDIKKKKKKKLKNLFRWLHRLIIKKKEKERKGDKFLSAAVVRYKMCGTQSVVKSHKKNPWRNQRAETVVVIIQTDCYILLMGPPPRSLKGKRRRRKRKKNELSIYNSLQVKSKASIVTGRERERERKKGIDWATPEENFATVSHSVRRIFLSFFVKKKVFGRDLFRSDMYCDRQQSVKEEEEKGPGNPFSSRFLFFRSLRLFQFDSVKRLRKEKKNKEGHSMPQPPRPSFFRLLLVESSWIR